MHKTLLVLGGGPDQLPGVLKAKEMGIYTIVLDGNPDAHCKSYADEFYSVSIKHIEQIDAFIEKIINRNVDGVIAFGVDIPFIIAYVANKLNVNYTVPLESAELSENKFISNTSTINILTSYFYINNYINVTKKYIKYAQKCADNCHM